MNRRVWLLVPSGLLAVGFVAWWTSTPADGKTAPVEQAASAPAPAEMQSAPAAPAALPASDIVRAQLKYEPAPTDLDVKVTSKGLEVRRAGHVIALFQGDRRAVDFGQAIWKQPDTAAGDIVFETTNEKDLTTERGRITWSDGKPRAERGPAPRVVSEEKAHHHECSGFEDGSGGFNVVCKVAAGANAGVVHGASPQEGVWLRSGNTSLVRFEMPLRSEGTMTKLIAYEKRLGVLVRAEASRAPGETDAVLSIGSDGHSQPHPVRRFCSCMLGVMDF